MVTLDRPDLVTTLPCLEDDVASALLFADELLEIALPADILRCGKQVRMVLGEIATKTRSPDPNLI